MKGLSILICFCTFLQVSAQDTMLVRSLEGIEIRADKTSQFLPGLAAQTADSLIVTTHFNASLASMLDKSSSLSIRSYGTGGIATLTYRGTTSSQSGIFWHGINLSQANIGMTDLSRVSPFLFNRIVLQSGGASALLGSGIFGGSVLIDNNLRYQTGLNTDGFISAKSTGGFSTGIKIVLGKRKLAYQGTANFDFNKNSFRYHSLSGEKMRLDHARTAQASLLHELEYKVSESQKLLFALWYQNTDRQLPASLTMQKSDQLQADYALRSVVQWSYFKKKYSVLLRFGGTHEDEHYSSKSADIDSRIIVKSYQLDAEYKTSLNKVLMVASGITLHSVTGDIDAYFGLKNQKRGAAWAALAFTAKRNAAKVAVNVRQDLAESYKVPFCPAISAQFPVTKSIQLTAAASRNYRIPTLNDRFWIPGGNPDLKAEESFNMECGLKVQTPSQAKYPVDFRITAYNMLITNMIEWVPGSNGLSYAQNALRVWSRGIELVSKTDFRLGSGKGYFRLNYNFSPSMYEAKSVSMDNILHKQLIYTPIHKINETIYFSVKQFYALCSVNYTGKRYALSDGSFQLPGYQLIDVYSGYSFVNSKFKTTITFAIKNLLNTTYQSVLYFPEPGINTELTLIIHI